MGPFGCVDAVVAVDKGVDVPPPQLTHNILAIHHSRTGPHTVILLTTTSTRLATASINAQTHLWWVFGLTAPADAPTAEHPGVLLGVHLHKMKGPKQVLRAATLWKEGVPLEQPPCFFDDKHARPEKLTEVPRLRSRRADTARRSVLDVPGQCLKVRHGHVTRGILAEVVVVGCLTGGHGHCCGGGVGGAGGGGRELCAVWCDVALSRSSWVRTSTHLEIPGAGSCLVQIL